MSYMKGDLLSRTRKLVKGLAKPTPVWLKAMEEAPPVVFPRCDSKIKRLEMPEDVYVKRFFKKHPSALDSLRRDPDKISGFDPPPARVFAWRVVELKEQGVSEAEAMAVADMEYKAEKKAKKAAYSELKKVNRLQGKKPPPNPYPPAIKEIKQAEKKYVRDRFFSPKVTEIGKRLAEENPDKQADRLSYGNSFGGGRPGWGNSLGSGGRPVGNNNFLNSGNDTGGGGRPGGRGDNNFLRNNNGGNFSRGGGGPGGWGNSNFLNNSNDGNFSGGGLRPGGLGNGNFLNNRNDGNFSGGGLRSGGLGNSNFLNNSNDGYFSGGGLRPGGLGNSNFLNNRNDGNFSGGGLRSGGWGNSNLLNNNNGGNFSGGGGRPDGWVDNNLPNINNVDNNNDDGGRPGGWGNNNFRR